MNQTSAQNTLMIRTKLYRVCCTKLQTRHLALYIAANFETSFFFKVEAGVKLGCLQDESSEVRNFLKMPPQEAFIESSVNISV